MRPHPRSFTPAVVSWTLAMRLHALLSRKRGPLLALHRHLQSASAGANSRPTVNRRTAARSANPCARNQRRLFLSTRPTFSTPRYLAYNSMILSCLMLYQLTCLILLAALVAPASAQFENVGTLSFPTSGSPAAQQHFLRGVAILHSFGWKQAIAEFKLAQQLQPDFAMAYWGETLCYNHPLQAEQDAKNAARSAGPARRDARGTRWRKRPPRARRGSSRPSKPLWGDGRLAGTPRRLHARHGAAARAVPQRR